MLKAQEGRAPVYKKYIQPTSVGWSFCSDYAMVWVPIFEKLYKNACEETMLKIVSQDISDKFKIRIKLFLVNTSYLGKYFEPICKNYLDSFLHR